MQVLANAFGNAGFASRFGTDVGMFRKNGDSPHL
jgi:hypothetical protein